MKGNLDIINIPSCTSNNSIAIIPSNMDFPSSSSSSSASASTSSSSSTTTSGGRAIDRHNPIITDEKRSGFSNSCNTTPLRTPLTNNILQKKPPSPTPPQSPLKKKGNNNKKLPTLTKKSTKKNTPTLINSPLYNNNNKKIINNDNDNNNDDDNNKSGRRSFSKASDLMMKASACSNTRPGIDYISPPESSRYLLDDTSFLEVLSDFDPVLKLVSREVNTTSDNKVEVIKSESTNKPPLPSSFSEPSDQVVVLRVSLHCRGCERKMKKHLSRMPGVRSFNIDFTAKKVTVVGDVTPLGVLSSISKVKTAQLWTPAMQSSSQLNYQRNMIPRK